MEKIYKVVFVYPDGHIEEVEEDFHNGRDALDYGNNLLSQVYNTEGVFQRSNESSLDEFGFIKEAIEPYYMIVEFKSKKPHLVYDSRNR